MTDNLLLRRERDLGGVIGDSFNILFANFRPIAAIVFPAAITSLALSLLVFAIDDDVVITLIFLASLIIQFLIFEFVRSAGVVYLDGLDWQTTIPSAESLDQAQHRLGIISGAAIRSSFIVVALSITLVGIPWAIMRIVRWALLSQEIMLEDKRGEDFLATSAELVKGFWWATAGRLLVTGVVVGIPTFISLRNRQRGPARTNCCIC